MGDFREIAKNYIDNGLWVIPVSNMKQPSISNWRDLQTRPMNDKEIDKGFKRCHGIALLMGGAPRLFAADFDLKYSLNPNLYDEIKLKIPREILEKTYVQKTKNGGYHWIYRIPESRLSGNEKFANRYTTAYEKHKIYIEYYEDPRTRDTAIKTAANHKSLVLLESRSGSIERCGGYVLMPPTEGYSFVYGKITELTEEEYDIVVETLRSFNEVKELGKIDKRHDTFDWEISPWDDYNERGDIVELLAESGWSVIDQSSKTIRFKRPGATSGSSALFDKESKIFNCFSTSTSLSVDKGYNAASLYIELECDGDGKLAYQNLISLGFGIKN
tara:strand:+ start:35413 stop:36402 length:990 start_codon:yes stop_codon:yes gene_type:complete